MAEFAPGRGNVQRLPAIRAEDAGEKRRLDASEQHIAVGDGERTLALTGDGERSFAWNGGVETCFLACGDEGFCGWWFLEFGFIGGFWLMGPIPRSVIISFKKYSVVRQTVCFKYK